MTSDCFFIVKRTADTTHLRLRRGYLAIHLRELSSIVTPSFCLILLVPCLGIAYLTGDRSVQLLDRILPGLVLFLFLFVVFVLMNLLSYVIQSIGWGVAIKTTRTHETSNLIVAYRGKQIQAPDTIRRSITLESSDPENGLGGSLFSEVVLTSKQGLPGASLHIRTPAHSTLQRQRIDAEGAQLSDWLEHELGLTRMK